MVRALLVAASILVLVPLAGCGADPPDPMSDRPPDDVVLEIELTPGGLPRGEPTTLRVTADGRFDVRSATETHVEDGLVATRHAPLAWRHQWTLGPKEMIELREAIARANDPPLDPRYGDLGSVDDGGVAVWRMRTDAGPVEVTVEGHPEVRVPALEALQRRLFELRTGPAQTSVWRVRAGGATVERRVGCDAATVPALQPMLAALFGPGGADPPAEEPAADAPGTEPLVNVTWLLDDEITERTIVYPSGRRSQWFRGKSSNPPSLGPAGLAALEEAIRSADWPSLADPVC